MDPKLAQAALSGDVAFLRATLTDCQSNNNNYYPLLAQKHALEGESEREVGNIFHLAAWKNKEEFFREAKESLPATVVQCLFCQQEPSGEFPGFNPLHVAAYNGHLEIVKLILDFYKKSPLDHGLDDDSKPWLAQDSNGSTPLQRALERKEHQECALQILYMDKETLCNIDDNEGNSPLFHAVTEECNDVALEILSSTHPYSLSGKDGATPLHAVMFSSEKVCRRLVEKHPQLIKAKDNSGSTVLHQWVLLDKIWPLEYLMKISDDNIPQQQQIQLQQQQIQCDPTEMNSNDNINNIIAPEWKKDLLQLMYTTDERGDNPFHVAGLDRKVEAAQALAKVYKQEIEAKKTVISSDHDDHDQTVQVPWLIPNKYGDTPVDLAIKQYEYDYDELSSFSRDNLLIISIEKGMQEAAELILATEFQYGWKFLPPPLFKSSDVVDKWLAERLPSLISEADEVINILHEASKVGLARLVESMLKKNPLALREAPMIWVEPCEKGYFATVLALIDNCPCFRELCLQNLDTPLHHVRFQGYEQYRSLLKNPVMWGLKNFQDSNGATPLHQAIRNRNILLTEVLLTTDEINRSIKDKKNKTAKELLGEVCCDSPEWDEMCKRNGIIPELKTTYFPDQTNLLEVRNSLSVVAALLATITFTAGFTLPGGFNSTSGQAILADKAAFLVFLLSDTFAMCCSMLVLVCLIWSMTCDHNRSLLLIEQSMSLLLLSLYSTLLAFMTGVYTVIHHKSLWAAIVILVMCSALMISSQRCFMYKVLDKLNPAIANKYKDEMRLLEQREASISLRREVAISSRHGSYSTSNYVSSGAECNLRNFHFSS